jgi:hypothetical protein
VPSNTHRSRLTSRDDLCGACRYMLTNSSFLLTSEPHFRRVPRVWCGWHKHIPTHSKHHRQRVASLTAKLDLTPPLSQSPSHAYIVQCLSKPASCAFLLASFPKNTRANGGNFRALFTHPQTKPRALYTAPTPPNPIQKAPKNTVMWSTEKVCSLV